MLVLFYSQHSVAEGFESLYEVVNNGTVIVNNEFSYILPDATPRSDSGRVIVYREANLKIKDHNYWGSPVSGQNFYSFSAGTPSDGFSIYKELTARFSSAGLNESSIFAPGLAFFCLK